MKPNIRFNGFSDEWVEKKLGDVSTVVRGSSPRPIHDAKWFDKTSDVGWLKISDVTSQNGQIKHLSLHLSELGQEKTRVLIEPHLLLSIAATVGSPVMTYVKTGVHDGFVIFEDSRFEKEFMFYRLELFKPSWKRYGQPGSQVNLNIDLVKNQKFNFPSLSEQQKIGLLFSKYDTIIALRGQKLAELNALKKGLLQQMFPKNGTKVPELRFAGFADDWEERKLGNLSNITTGKLDANAMSENGEYDFYTSGIKKYRIDAYAFEGEAITIAGNGANVGYLHIADGKFNAYQRTYVLQDFKVNREFIYFEIGQKLPHKILQESRTGSIPYIVIDMLMNLKLIVPSLPEQQKIGQSFKHLDTRILNEQSKIEQLKAQKQGLLQRML